MASWRCSVCGRDHDELPNSLSWGKPYDYFAASDDEKQGFVALDDDRCHLNDERHFLRCTLELPILDTHETLVLGVWIGVSKTNFYQYAEFLVNKTNEPDPPLLYGVLCGVLPGFTEEELLWTEVMIRIRRDGLVPEVVIADPKHALYRAYNHGVSHEYWHLMLRELQPEVARQYGL